MNSKKKIMDLNSYFKRYKTKKDNRLLNAIMYQLSIMDEIDYRLFFTVQLLNVKLNEKFNVNYDINFIIMIVRLVYNSSSVISNLPHILNKTMVNGKPCLHIIMGESMAQLVSLSLINEINNVLNVSLKKLYNDINLENEIKCLFMKLFDEIHLEEAEKHEHLLNEEYNDERIKKVYELNKNKIFKATERLCYEYYNFMINKRVNKYNVRLIKDENDNYYFEEYIKNDYNDDNQVRNLNTYLIKETEAINEYITNDNKNIDKTISNNKCLLD